MTSKPHQSTKPVILIICNYYLPGYKTGGSLRTIVNTVERLSDRFDFRIVCLNHDGDHVPYKNIKYSEWNNASNAQVYYLQPDEVKISKLHELISKVKPEAIYVNSVFSKLTIFTLLLRKISRLSQIPLILAPEGELAIGALQLKATKKSWFLRFAKLIRLHRNLYWKTTSEYEKQEALNIMGKGGEVFIAPNLPAKSLFENYDQNQKPHKIPGEVKIVFLSRFMETKNFNWLLKLPGKIAGDITIHIYGNIEDSKYWDETLNLIEKLPENFKVEYKGALAYEQVVKTLFEYHFFILPTLGENFGHVFIEALAAGCPLITSNRTPWRDLEVKRIGWDIPLEEPNRWVSIINYCIQLDDSSYRKISSSARKYAQEWLADPQLEEMTLRIFEKILSDA